MDDTKFVPVNLLLTEKQVTKKIIILINLRHLQEVN